MMVGWKGKDVAKERVVHFSCMLNWFRVSLLGCLVFVWHCPVSIMCFTLSGGVHFLRRWYRLCLVPFASVGGA